jgi:hypothetical protein
MWVTTKVVMLLTQVRSQSVDLPHGSWWWHPTGGVPGWACGHDTSQPRHLPSRGEGPGVEGGLCVRLLLLRCSAALRFPPRCLSLILAPEHREVLVICLAGVHRLPRGTQLWVQYGSPHSGFGALTAALTSTQALGVTALGCLNFALVRIRLTRCVASPVGRREISPRGESGPGWGKAPCLQPTPDATSRCRTVLNSNRSMPGSAGCGADTSRAQALLAAVTLLPACCAAHPCAAARWVVL